MRSDAACCSIVGICVASGLNFYECDAVETSASVMNGRAVC